MRAPVCHRSPPTNVFYSLLSSSHILYPSKSCSITPTVFIFQIPNMLCLDQLKIKDNEESDNVDLNPSPTINAPVNLDTGNTRALSHVEKELSLSAQNATIDSQSPCKSEPVEGVVQRGQVCSVTESDENSSVPGLESGVRSEEPHNPSCHQHFTENTHIEGSQHCVKSEGGNNFNKSNEKLSLSVNQQMSESSGNISPELQQSNKLRGNISSVVKQSEESGDDSSHHHQSDSPLSHFTCGDLVWVKLMNTPWWPAKVSLPGNQMKSFSISFCIAMINHNYSVHGKDNMNS